MKKYSSKFHEWEFTSYYITTVEDAEKTLPHLTAEVLCGLDIETAKKPEYKDHPMAGLCPLLSKIRLLQIYNSKTNAVFIFDMFSVPWDALSIILKANRFVAHNAIFEAQHLTHQGFKDLNIGCSMLLSQLIDGAERSIAEPEIPITDILDEDTNDDKDGLSRYRFMGHNLDACIQREFGVKVEKIQQTSDWGKAVLDDEQITYAGLDALLTYKLANKLSGKIKEYKMEKSYTLLKQMQHVVAHMQLTGMPVDWGYHAKLMAEWKVKLEESLKACKPFYGNINIHSGKQMNEWVVNYFKNEPLLLASWPKSDKGAYSFSKIAITQYKHIPAIVPLLEYKKYAKLLDTYGESLIEKKHPVTGRLHTSYTLGETRTGRLSSRKPNVQNFPRDKWFRNMFAVEGDHVLVVSDFSQIELRLQAEFSKDPVMQEVYRKGEDIYCSMASTIYSKKITKENKTERFIGKTVMLALGYGMGAKKLGLYALNAGIVQPQEFWDLAWKTYHNKFKVYSLWCDKVRERARRLKYIETYMGKRRKLVESELYTRAPNTVIQGSASELMMLAMLNCYKAIQGIGHIVATVHDEILLCVNKNQADTATKVLSKAMNDAMIMMFPDAACLEVADAAYGERWGDVKGEL